MNGERKKTRDCSVVILGDSYSTFKGHIPAHQAFYYPNPDKVPDLTQVEQTWWHRLTQRRNMRILSNDSYSGSTVCNHTRDGQPPESAFIYRMQVSLSEKGIAGEKPGVIMIFGATNDSWLNRRIGQLKFSQWDEADLLAVVPAYCYLLDYVTRNNPQAEILCIVNDVLKPEIRSGIEKAAEHYNAKAIILEGIEKSFGHPTCRGMAQIDEQINRALEEESRHLLPDEDMT